jgi:stress response protein YsnF
VDANLKEIKEEIMARLEAMIQKNQEKMKATHEKIDAKIDTNQEKMDIDTNNEKFVILQGTHVSWMVIHHAKPMSTQEEMKAKMDAHQKNMEATIHSI